MIDIDGKNLSGNFVKYKKIGCWSFLMPKSANKCHFWGWLVDTIGIIQNMIIDIDGENFSGNFVKYEKIGCRSFLMYKSAKQCLLSV